MAKRKKHDSGVDHSQRAMKKRAAMAIFAMIGTILYVASFALHGLGKSFFSFFMALGVSAAVSWVLWGPILLTVTKGWGRPLRWADTALYAMTGGMALLMLGLLMNVLQAVTGWPGIASRTLFLVVHLVILFIADIVMWLIFQRMALRRGMQLQTANGLWIGLNVLFAALLILLRGLGAWN